MTRQKQGSQNALIVEAGGVRSSLSAITVLRSDTFVDEILATAFTGRGSRAYSDPDAFRGRFMDSIAVGDPEDCWDWLGTVGNHGYGTIGLARSPRLAHRVSYALFVADIPEGLHIDHLCSNRTCVNPFHLEPVTLAENNRRAHARKKEKTLSLAAPRAERPRGSGLMASALDPAQERPSSAAGPGRSAPGAADVQLSIEVAA